MTTADDGHALVNSTEAWTDVGTAERAICSNPNAGKYVCAVVVNK
jgi:hypothetical protein